MTKVIFPTLLALGLLFTFAVRAPAQAPAPAPEAAVPASAAQTAFAQSLVFRTDRVIADPTHPMMVWLAQTAPVSYAAPGALRLKVALYTADAAPKLVRELGETFVFGVNLASQPWPFALNLAGVANGDYQCRAEVWAGATLLGSFQVSAKLVAGLDTKLAEFEPRLALIDGHDSAKASIRYPFDLARVINLGKRVFGSSTGNPEFGLNQAGAPTLYDFTAGLKRSGELLAALEAGHDPVWRAGGETVRHYHMAEADEILPYRVFVPSTWDGKAALPLVFILHGNSRDQDFYFERDDHIIPRTAEKHGFMLVAPLGYAPNAGYNYNNGFRGAPGVGTRGVAGAVATPQNFGPPLAGVAGRGGRGARGGAGFGGVNGSVTPALVRSEWSEQDAMHVFDLIKKEYPIDPKRTFLFGYSAGGQGAHYLGPKFAENWAAIAIGGSNAQPGPGYQFDRVKATPYFLFYGTADAGNGPPAIAMAAAINQNGGSVVVKSYQGANHDQAPSAAIADIFDFFAAHLGR